MYKFNDWQDLSLKKDIERLLKQSAKSENTALALSFDFAIAILVLCIDKLLDWQNAGSYGNFDTIYWGCVLLGFLPFIFISIAKLCKWIAKTTAGMRTFSAEALVDLFDNELCVYIMMAQSYINMYDQVGGSLTDTQQHNDGISGSTSGQNTPQTVDENGRVFAYIEACFYINKVITGLTKMSSAAEKIFSNSYDELITEKRISLDRLMNMVRLLSELMKRTSVLKVSDSNDIALTKTLNESNRKALQTFCQDMNNRLNCELITEFDKY